MAYLDLLESDGEVNRDAPHFLSNEAIADQVSGHARQHLIASAPPPIPLATRPCVSNDTAPPFQPCSESFVAAATSRTSDVSVSSSHPYPALQVVLLRHKRWLIRFTLTRRHPGLSR